jgi:hypothetical protein
MQVAAAFKTKPSTVLQALRSTAASSNTASLEAPSYSGPASAKGEESNVPWSALLTSTDLDDEDDDGPGGVPNTGVAGHGSFFAAAGQVPGWMQRVQSNSSSSSSGSSQAADAPMQTLLNTQDDAEWAAEQQVQRLMQVLTPRERGILQLLYGSDAVELLQAAEASSSSSSGEKAGWESRSSWTTAVTSAGPRKANGSKGSTGLRQPFAKGAVPLAAVAAQYDISIERTRQLRVSALRKLQLAAADPNLLDAAAEQAAAAAAEPDAEPDAVDLAIEACAPCVRALLQLLRDYYAEHGCAPTKEVVIAGKWLGNWCVRQLQLYERKELSIQQLTALQLVAPGWLPDAAGVVQQQQQQQQREKPVRRRRQQSQLRQQQGSDARGADTQQQQQQQQQHSVLQQDQQHVQVQSSAAPGQGQERLQRLRQQRQETLATTLDAAVQEAVVLQPVSQQQQQHGLRLRKPHPAFARRFVELQQFLAQKQRYPSRLVKAERSLCMWLHYMRRIRREGKARASHVAALEALPGFSWEEDRQLRQGVGRGLPAFARRFAELQLFLDQQQRYPRHSLQAERSLFEWLMYMRKNRRLGKLPPSQVAALESLPGFRWEGRWRLSPTSG